MPISSGANSWPASYWHKPSPKQPNTKLVVIDQGQSRPPSPVRRPSPPPSPIQVKRPPPEDTEMVFVDHRSPPPPQRGYIQDHPPPSQHVTYMSQQRPPPHQQVIYSKPPPPHNFRAVNHGYSGYRDYGYPPYPQSGGGFCGDSTCCADNFFSTNTSGANAGCCQGGMFGSRGYPYSAEHSYIMKGTGRRRCCACFWGLLLGLLLLGLLIGLLAGLLPALQKKSAINSVLAKFQNGYLVNGVYYYKVTNPPDIFYFAMGPGIPCNPNNNNSLVKPATPGYIVETVSTFNVTENVTSVVTQEPVVTLPDCNSITTSFILANGISVSTTTINPFLVLTSSAGALYAKAFATLLAITVIRLCLALETGTE